MGGSESARMDLPAHSGLHGSHNPLRDLQAAGVKQNPHLFWLDDHRPVQPAI
ncbi:hypothetical protein [Methanothrix soehngenii]|uniref:hypothetical protein n=1 Tax=Methanothrix soehngenii TaxID=2223 RepID=UPI00300C0450